MKKINRILFWGLVNFVWMVGCTKDETNSSENLHISFTTPEWNAVIDCNELSFDYTKYATYSPTSASTNLQWTLTLPQDSSLLNQPSNIKKYPIIGYESSFNYPPFAYLQKVPFTQGSSIKLVPIANDSITENSYHQISAITYDHSDASAAYFKVKASYKMKMRKLPATSDPDSVRFVYGDYLIMVLVNKK